MVSACFVRGHFQSRSFYINVSCMVEGSTDGGASVLHQEAQMYSGEHHVWMGLSSRRIQRQDSKQQ